MHTLQHLFEDQLRDIYYAENQIAKALPKMAKAASYSELQKAFGCTIVQIAAAVGDRFVLRAERAPQPTPRSARA